MNVLGYFGWIEKFLSPPGIRQPNLGRIYRLFGALAGSYASERTWLLRQHFALTCGLEYLPRLGRIFGLPRWSFESDEGYRGRLATAGFELEGRGSLRSFDWFMRGLCGREWHSNGEATAIFAIGRTAVNEASIGGISALRVGIKAVQPFVVGSSAVSIAAVDGAKGGAQERELSRFLDWFLAADIAYEIYYL